MSLLPSRSQSHKGTDHRSLYGTNIGRFLSHEVVVGTRKQWDIGELSESHVQGLLLESSFQRLPHRQATPGRSRTTYRNMVFIEIYMVMGEYPLPERVHPIPLLIGSDSEVTVSPLSVHHTAHTHHTQTEHPYLLQQSESISNGSFPIRNHAKSVTKGNDIHGP